MRIRRMLGSQAERDVLRTEQAVTSKLPNSQVQSGQRNIHKLFFNSLNLLHNDSPEQGTYPWRLTPFE